MNLRNPLRIFINPWVVLGAIGVGVILFVTAVALLLVTRSLPAPLRVPTAAITVVAFPTATVPDPTATRPNIETPTALPQSSPQPGEIYLGAFAQITDTGGDGLRLRVEPSLDGEILILGRETEVFQVQDGPVKADGFSWWYLVSPENSARQGWAVSDYLVLAELP